MKNRKRDRRPARSRPGKRSEVDINEATSSYEKWMRGCTTVIASDLRSKHEQMKESPFLFLRGNLLQVGSTVAVRLCRSV